VDVLAEVDVLAQSIDSERSTIAWFKVARVRGILIARM
jgi:hypothetical protein